MVKFLQGGNEVQTHNSTLFTIHSHWAKHAGHTGAPCCQLYTGVGVSLMFLCFSWMKLDVTHSMSFLLSWGKAKYR